MAPGHIVRVGDVVRFDLSGKGAVYGRVAGIKKMTKLYKGETSALPRQYNRKGEVQISYIEIFAHTD